MPRSAFVPLLLLATLAAGRAQPLGSGLVGHLEGATYFAPTGAYKVDVPVRPETGGIVSDTDNVVTFQDDYNLLYIIACFRMDTSQRWEASIHPPKEYLQGFFNQYVLPDFRRAFPGVQVENTGIFYPALMDGALVVYTLLPGGSMFASKVAAIDLARKPPAAKRGNMIFVKNGFVYVISTELAERVTEGSAYGLTPQEEDVRLREKLQEMVAKIHFLTPPAAP